MGCVWKLKSCVTIFLLFFKKDSCEGYIILLVVHSSELSNKIVMEFSKSWVSLIARHQADWSSVNTFLPWSLQHLNQHFCLYNRELKQRRRRWQQQCHNTIGLMSKNNRSAHAFYIFVHFFAVLCKTATWNDQILGFLENVSTRRWISFLS